MNESKSKECPKGRRGEYEEIVEREEEFGGDKEEVGGKMREENKIEGSSTGAIAKKRDFIEIGMENVDEGEKEKKIRQRRKRMAKREKERKCREISEKTNQK